MSHRTKLRGAVAALACTAALMAGSTLLSLPAQAENRSAAATAPAAAPSTRQMMPTTQIELFLRDYLDAINGQHSEGHSPAKVREDHLTKKLDAALTDWGVAHQADPIFRAQNLPTGWSLRDADSSPEGHATVIVTENFESGTTIDVWFQINLDGRLIDGITDPPAPAAS
ncbi:hypothetical protein [Kitasatospora sp. NPDC002040]|uniref:hypothetical protein n=1 Tax=Kitasatospora sp. NPDC002040 TaxID=3154661 RepID=UPI003319681D